MTNHKAARRRFSPPTKADMQADAASVMLAALHESAMANEKAFHDLAIYAGVDTIAPSDWFRAKYASLSEATRKVRAAIAQAEAAGIK